MHTFLGVFLIFVFVFSRRFSKPKLRLCASCFGAAPAIYRPLRTERYLCRCIIWQAYLISSSGGGGERGREEEWGRMGIFIDTSKSRFISSSQELLPPRGVS